MDRNRLIVSLLLLLQALSTGFLWTLDPTNGVSQTKFAIFLSVDLLAFAMIGYVFLSQRWGELFSKALMLSASFGLVVLLFSSLLFP
jgi:hypothetical protein